MLTFARKEGGEKGEKVKSSSPPFFSAIVHSATRSRMAGSLGDSDSSFGPILKIFEEAFQEN